MVSVTIGLSFVEVLTTVLFHFGIFLDSLGDLWDPVGPFWAPRLKHLEQFDDPEHLDYNTISSYVYVLVIAVASKWVAKHVYAHSLPFMNLLGQWAFTVSMELVRRILLAIV